jgi:hypothetical protein
MLHGICLRLWFIESKPGKKEKVIEKLGSHSGTEDIEYNVANKGRDHHRAKIRVALACWGS